jgi:hypothetical protein
MGDDDFNADLSLNNTGMLKRGGTRNQFNVTLKSQKKRGLGNTGDFGHAFAPKASLKRKDSTCSANST